MLNPELVGPGLGIVGDSCERIVFYLVRAVMETCPEGEPLEGVELHAATIRDCLLVHGVVRLLERALGKVERIEQHLVASLVCVLEREVVHLEVRLSEPESPGEQGLHVHRVYGDVPAGKGNARGVAPEGKVRRAGDVLVLVFLGILVGAALHAEVERHRVGNEPAEIEVQCVAVEGPAFPGDIGNGGIYGNAVPFLEQNAVLAVER